MSSLPLCKSLHNFTDLRNYTIVQNKSVGRVSYSPWRWEFQRCLYIQFPEVSSVHRSMCSFFWSSFIIFPALHLRLETPQICFSDCFSLPDITFLSLSFFVFPVSFSSPLLLIFYSVYRVKNLLVTDSHCFIIFFYNCAWWQVTNVFHASCKQLGLHGTLSSEPSNPGVGENTDAKGTEIRV